MARYSSMPDRDEQGRFMSDDDRGHSRGGDIVADRSATKAAAT